MSIINEDRKCLRELPQYHFSRDTFVNAFKKVFTNDEIFNLEVACQEHKSTDDFLLYYYEDEFYIIDLVSGTIINWYKNLGRTNTCNKEEFNLDDLMCFLRLLKESMKDYLIIQITSTIDMGE